MRIFFLRKGEFNFNYLWTSQVRKSIEHEINPFLPAMGASNFILYVGINVFST